MGLRFPLDVPPIEIFPQEMLEAVFEGGGELRPRAQENGMVLVSEFEPPAPCHRQPVLRSFRRIYRRGQASHKMRVLLNPCCGPSWSATPLRVQLPASSGNRMGASSSPSSGCAGPLRVHLRRRGVDVGAGSVAEMRAALERQMRADP